MRCPRCSFDNPIGAKFCGRCGTKLGNLCPSCGASNPEGFAFCGTCGTRLTTTDAPAVASQPTEERKVVTVLFADLTGSTTITERLDPEQMRAIMSRFFEVMTEEIQRFGGTVEKFIGDEVMTVFGLPTAHEDDPARAIHAAVAMHERLQTLNAQLHQSHGVSLQMRIGINTGEVVANPQAAEKGEFMVTGDAVNVAARLRGAASPDTTMVGERTYRDTAWLAEYRSSGALTLKGKSEPVNAWQVVSLLPEPVRPAATGLRAPLVGREAEFVLLQGMFQRVVRERKAHLVTIAGMPGTGKTRLFQELISTIPKPTLVYQGRSPAYASTSLWAVAEIIRADCAILRNDSLPTVVEKLTQRVGSLLGTDRDAGEAKQITAHLARVLAVRGLDAGTSQEGSRDELFWSLRRYFEGLTGRAPLILAFEDLQWGDTELLDVIEYLAQWSGGPLLIVCLARPELLEGRPGWGGGKRNYTSLFLEPLTGEDTRRLLQGMLETDTPPSAVAEAVSVAEGNPLFVEEILRMLLDSGALRRTDGRWEIAGSLTPTIPHTIQGVITARLDRLSGEEKSILQEAAILGTRFWTGALTYLTGMAEAKLGMVLQTLQAKDFLVEQERSQLLGQREFILKSTMIRDVAYGMLPKSRRSEKHRAFGAWLERTYRDRAGEFADILAYHWLQAARLAQEIGQSDLWKEAAPNALRYALMAAQKAAHVYANEQAVTHYRNARELADAVGADSERIAAIEGLADVYALQARWEEASRLYQEALEYHARKGDAVQQARVQSRIGSTFSGVFDFRQALPHIKAAVEKLESHQEEAELAGVYVQMARTQTYLGNFQEAEKFASEGLRLAEQYNLPTQQAEAKAFMAWIEVMLGRPGLTVVFDEYIAQMERLNDLTRAISGYHGKGAYHLYRGEYGQARASLERGLSLATEISHRPRLAISHYNLGVTYWRAGEWSLAKAAYERYLSMSEALSSWVEHARSVMAFMEGDVPAALTWIRKAVTSSDQRREIATLGFAVDFCGFLYIRADQAADGYQFLAEYLNRFGQMGVFWPAYLHPLAAETALMLGNLEKAPVHCDQAETYRPLELKPAVARLHRARGLLHAAREQWDQAVSNMTQAVSTYQEIGQPYDRALCLETLADIHGRRGGTGDRDRVTQLRSEAITIYQQLGADFEVRRLQESTSPQ